jgi:MFS transporter, OFA family, oxalate/formate antiporter
MSKRWKNVLGAIGIHISIGSLYAWSQISNSIQNDAGLNWSLSKITLAFSIAVIFVGITTAFMGRFVEKYGPRRSGLIAAFSFGFGLMLSGLSVKFSQVWLLYLGYGVFSGIGIGLGYITPVSTILKSFPGRRGFAMGLAIMGFGFGAMLEIFLLKEVLPRFGLTSIGSMMIALGIIYGLLMFVSSILLSTVSAAEVKEKSVSFALSSIQSLRTTRFYLLWVMLFINVSCGISIISVAVQLGVSKVHMSLALAASFVIFMSIFNGVGRFIWAYFSDYITRPITYMLFFLIQIIAFFIIASSSSKWLFEAMVFLILTCYGGGFALIPAFIADVFGLKEPGTIHGYILTAWAAAGLVGPMLIALISDHAGSFSYALYIYSGFSLIGLILAVFMAVDFLKVKRSAAVNEDLMR